MKKILFTFLFLLVAFPVYAYELLMFTSVNCIYCQNWFKEVAPTYEKSEYAKVLPLHTVNIDKAPPQWIRRAVESGRLEPIRVTPTFVVWKNREIIRTEGYVNRDQFYMVMDGFMEYVNGDLGSSPKVIPRTEGSNGMGPGVGDRKFNPKNPPDGVVNSRDIFKHMYKTAEEALAASKWLGCKGNVHYHDEEAVWMPCVME